MFSLLLDSASKQIHAARQHNVVLLLQHPVIQLFWPKIGTRGTLFTAKACFHQSFMTKNSKPYISLIDWPPILAIWNVHRYCLSTDNTNIDKVKRNCALKTETNFMNFRSNKVWVIFSSIHCTDHDRINWVIRNQLLIRVFDGHVSNRETYKLAKTFFRFEQQIHIICNKTGSQFSHKILIGNENSKWGAL